MFEGTIDDSTRIRMLHETDADELFRVVDANRQHLRDWLPWLDANTSPEHTRQFIQGALRQYAQNQGFVCVIVYNSRIVGVAGFNTIHWSNKSAELGYWLCKDMVGRGLATRSCSTLVGYAFNDLGLNRVTMPIAVGNKRSRAVAERLGFKQEGVIRDAEWLYDHFVDHALYAKLKRDWIGGPHP